MPSHPFADHWPDYALGQGLSIFDLAPRSKTPLPGTHGALDATGDITVNEGRAARNPAGNIAAACGGGRVVIDVDDRAHVDVIWHLLPKAPAVVTARGVQFHTFCDHHIASRTRVPMVIDGKVYLFDVKAGASSYVVLPFSIHPSGAEYRLDEDGPDLRRKHLVPTPEIILAAIAETLALERVLLL